MNLTFLQSGPSLDMLNSTFFMFTTIIVAVVAVIGFLVYRYFLEPPICRQFMSAKWKAGTPAFIQDNANVVHFTMSDKDLPEGILHNKKGWFLLPRTPYLPEDQAKAKRGVGRPPKEAEGDNSKELSDDQKEALKTVLQVPTLAGFGKAVFFGYVGSPLLANLETLAKVGDKYPVEADKKIGGHADLRVLKEVIPATISRTQLGNLYKWALSKGYEKRGGDQMKLIYIALAAAIPIACLGIVAFLLINGKGA